jgi:hypothetical protein
VPTQHPCRGRLHHIEHIQLPRPRRRGVQGRARHRDPDQLGIPLGHSNAVLAIALVGHRGSPKPLPSSQEAGVIENCVRHEPSIGLPPAPDIHARHLRDVLDPGTANRQRGTHRRIVGRQPPPAAPEQISRRTTQVRQQSAKNWIATCVSGIVSVRAHAPRQVRRTQTRTRRPVSPRPRVLQRGQVAVRATRRA